MEFGVWVLWILRALGSVSGSPDQTGHGNLRDIIIVLQRSDVDHGEYQKEMGNGIPANNSYDAGQLRFRAAVSCLHVSIPISMIICIIYE